VDGSGTWVHTNIYAAGQLVATYQNDQQGVHFYLTDWLGTRRVQTDYTGNPEQTCTSNPFGDALPCVGATEHFFTGKERDSESGLDNFGARFFASTMGRFMSPDWSASPSAVPYASLSNPQTLNLYIYVGNNPLSGTDGDGHVENRWGWNDPIWGGGSDGPEGTKEMQSAAQRHDSIIYNNYDPDGIAHDRFGYAFTGAPDTPYEHQRQEVAIAWGTASVGEDNNAAAAIQTIYDQLTINSQATDQSGAIHSDGLVGGHYNFIASGIGLNGMPLDPTPCFMGRCGVVHGNHFEHGSVHNDFMNPFSMPPVGGMVHLFHDQIYGTHLQNNGNGAFDY
jgi:RHS repeat-associated protein